MTFDKSLQDMTPAELNAALDALAQEAADAETQTAQVKAEVERRGNETIADKLKDWTDAEKAALEEHFKREGKLPNGGGGR